MKTVRFHPEAEAEMMEAAAYYEAQQDDLGKRFLASVWEAIGMIAENVAAVMETHYQLFICDHIAPLAENSSDPVAFARARSAVVADFSLGR